MSGASPHAGAGGGGAGAGNGGENATTNPIAADAPTASSRQVAQAKILRAPSFASLIVAASRGQADSRERHAASSRALAFNALGGAIDLRSGGVSGGGGLRRGNNGFRLPDGDGGEASALPAHALPPAPLPGDGGLLPAQGAAAAGGGRSRGRSASNSSLTPTVVRRSGSAHRRS